MTVFVCSPAFNIFWASGLKAQNSVVSTRRALAIRSARSIALRRTIVDNLWITYCAMQHISVDNWCITTNQ